MNVLIATLLYPPQIGGPATYAKGLAQAFEQLGHHVDVVTYSEQKGGVWSVIGSIRYFFKLRTYLKGCDVIIALDTLPVGLPASIIGKLMGIPTIVRVVGDPIWESYVARTGDPIPFPKFYLSPHRMSIRERLLYVFTKLTFRFARRIVFATRWQMEVRLPVYPIAKGKSLLLENSYFVIPNIMQLKEDKKIFLWAGREAPLKNIAKMKEAFGMVKLRHPEIELECIANEPHVYVQERILHAYALLLPSVSEDAPNFLIEGIAQGKPFITTLHNGLYDRIHDLGIFVDTADVGKLADAIERMVDDHMHHAYQERIRSWSVVRTYQDLVNDYIAIVKTL